MYLFSNLCRGIKTRRTRPRPCTAKAQTTPCPDDRGECPLAGLACTKETPSTHGPSIPLPPFKVAGTIGTGLFLGTGRSLAQGGPASMLICYGIVGSIVYITLLLLGEMGTQYPVAGE